MLRLRHQGDDTFRWARNETKREMVMSQSSYAKVAGLQSEIGRVVVTRVAGSELEYKRTLNMYRKDLAVSVNGIKREQIKMRRRMGRYVKKLKQTRVENAKRLKDEQLRDKERAALEELHIRLKMEAAARTPEPEQQPYSYLDINEERPDSVSPSHSELSTGNHHTDHNMYLQTGAVHEPEEHFWRKKDSGDKSKGYNSHTHAVRKESRVFSPILPMINEDAEKDDDESDKLNISNCEIETQTEEDVPDVKLMDEDMSISSYGGRKKKKNNVSFSDIIKLKYSGTKHLFDLVHILAKKHGIPDVVAEKVPDPRDNVVLRGSTNDSLRLQASVLYPIKYGYAYEADDDVDGGSSFKSSKSPNVLSDTTEHPADDHSPSEPVPVPHGRVRKLSLEQRRAIFMSGRHSKSVDGDDLLHGPSSRGSTRQSRSRDTTMTSLVDKVTKIKIERAERLSERAERMSERFSGRTRYDSGDSAHTHNPRLLSPLKPSSSHSSRSLPAMSKLPGREDEKVSWTQAFGLLRAIHSLEDIT